MEGLRKSNSILTAPPILARDETAENLPNELIDLEKQLQSQGQQ